jgi:hypothetical protein
VSKNNMWPASHGLDRFCVRPYSVIGPELQVTGSLVPECRDQRLIFPDQRKRGSLDRKVGSAPINFRCRRSFRSSQVKFTFQRSNFCCRLVLYRQFINHSIFQCLELHYVVSSCYKELLNLEGELLFSAVF